MKESLEQMYKWDKKSENFPRYDKQNEQFQTELLYLLKKDNIISKDSKVLDVGCGTGIFTIPLAYEVKEVIAMDISSKMLEILEEDKKNLGLNNIKTIQSNWDDFNRNEQFDVVFASKTPAIKEDKDYEKMMSSSKRYLVYLGFAGKKESNIQKELLKRFPSLEFRKFNDTPNLKNWLKKKGLKYSSKIYKQSFSRQMTEKMAYMQIAEYLSNSEFKLNDAQTKEIIHKIRNNNNLIYRIDTKLELLIWEK